MARGVPTIMQKTMQNDKEVHIETYTCILCELPILRVIHFELEAVIGDGYHLTFVGHWLTFSNNSKQNLKIPNLLFFSHTHTNVSSCFYNQPSNKLSTYDTTNHYIENRYYFDTSTLSIQPIIEQNDVIF